ncbi:MAG: OB-fold domain-containing protein [Candidatus Hydrogenedentes bacterium]|nr:OB-fold domain-containing protein [Candidatus Hydrogenedentota bacterium]
MPEKEKQELIVSRQVLSIPQRFATGPIMGRFLAELRDNRRIMAVRVPGGRCLLPPREVDAVSHQEATEWVEVGPGGVIRDVDVVYYASPDPLTGETRDVPYVICWVDLDGAGADSPLWHLLDAPDLGKVRRGARVRAVFNEERSGCMEDIKHFELVD